MSTVNLKEKLDAVRTRIARAAERSGRTPGQIRLVAVSKTLPADVIRKAYDIGLRIFGENRVQELTAKAGALPNDIHWHLIGHLQRNKVRAAVRQTAWIHAVDSPELLRRIDRISAQEGKHPSVLLQVNITHEPTKAGVSVEEAPGLLATAMECPHLDCRGFMTMAAFEVSESEVRDCFRNLRILRDRLTTETGADLPELSMGMSGDFELAIEEGATMVRVGTAIFGHR